MTPEQLIIVILLAGIMGAIGQGARAVVGLKKASDQASREHGSLADVFVASRLLVSLLIGFIAGVFALLALGPEKLLGTDAKTQTLLGLMAAGYAGTDFIEGFMSKYLPGTELPAGPPAGRPQAPVADIDADAETGLPPAMG